MNSSKVPRWRMVGSSILSALVVGAGAMAAEAVPQRDAQALFPAADHAGRVGVARKTKPVDARPAVAGEVIVTVIAGEGEETRSKPAEAGDWVVRNRCPVTGDEQYLVKAAKFGERYAGPTGEPDAAGWREFQPRGPELRFFTVGPDEGAFTFTAPWGEAMVARPGDAIVQDPKRTTDTYRVARDSFTCTYEILTQPQRS